MLLWPFECGTLTTTKNVHTATIYTQRICSFDYKKTWSFDWLMPKCFNKSFANKMAIWFCEECKDTKPYVAFCYLCIVAVFEHFISLICVDVFFLCHSITFYIHHIDHKNIIYSCKLLWSHIQRTEGVFNHIQLKLNLTEN